MLKNKQGGFTLLELLVVITLLAVLSVGALVAYEGIGENASNVAAANNIKTADSSIRAYRAIENVYPNQWDNLANLGGELTGGAFEVLADKTKSFVGQAQFDETNAAAVAAMVSLGKAGVTELQTLTTAATIDLALVSPNEAFNESAPGVDVPADEVEWALNDDGTLDLAETEDLFFMSVVPSSVAGVANDCQFAGNDLTSNLAGDTVADSKALNRINDNLDDDGCHLVVALGFGKDVPGTTLGSRVAISTAPTYTNGNVVNPSIHYARYIALFHLGSADEDGATPGEVTAADILAKPRLIAVVDTEGRNIDQAIAGAYASN